MADSSKRWDTQTLGFGLAVGLLGAVMLLGRHSSSLRPVHLLGVVILGFGVAVLVGAAAVGRRGHAPDGPGPVDD